MQPKLQSSPIPTWPNWLPLGNLLAEKFLLFPWANAFLFLLGCYIIIIEGIQIPQNKFFNWAVRKENIMRLTVDNKMEAKEVRTLVQSVRKGTVKKSAAMRELFAGGLSVKEIQEVLECRYQVVYNTIKNEVLKMGLQDSIEKEGRSGGEKAATILALLQEGKTFTEVAQETRTIYNYVWAIAKKNGIPSTRAKAAAAAEVEA
jgi:hypothetical protein